MGQTLVRSAFLLVTKYLLPNVINLWEWYLKQVILQSTWA